jgi:hypothetical protein
MLRELVGSRERRPEDGSQPSNTEERPDGW